MAAIDALAEPLGNMRTIAYIWLLYTYNQQLSIHRYLCFLYAISVNVYRFDLQYMAKSVNVYI